RISVQDLPEWVFKSYQNRCSSCARIRTGEERIQKAITRLFMIAFLECQQPKLDSVSRMALLYALDSLPGEDPIITALVEQLRQRPFYIICHEGRFQGARKAESDRAVP
ncbi:hypothetical protein, partial [Kistimonas scapharcae]|uniref:hypothetical protein n=1 Tax=Kistimonas scapharcae TaxID=1036133 RepID=UPI0031F07842